MLVWHEQDLPIFSLLGKKCLDTVGIVREACFLLLRWRALKVYLGAEY